MHNNAVKTIAYLFLSVVAVLAAIAAAIAVFANTLNKESKAFVDASLPAIISDWDVTEIQKRASPEFNGSVDYDDLQQLFDALREFGELQEYHGATGEAKTSFSIESGIMLTAFYDARADFEEGTVDIQVSLVRREGRWQILGFNIAPDDREERKNII